MRNAGLRPSEANMAAEDAAYVRSEEKRLEALDCTQRARERQDQNDTTGMDDEVKAAWDCIQESLEFCPSNHKARFLLMSFAMNADDWSTARREALLIYRDLTRPQMVQMNDPVLHLSIVHACKMLGLYPEAQEYCAEAMELFEEDPQPWMVLGELHLLEGRFPEAESECRRALELHGEGTGPRPLSEQNEIFTLCNLGSCLMKQQPPRLDDAEELILRAQRIDTASVMVLHHLLDLREAQGRVPEAIICTERLQDALPEDASIKERAEKLRAGLPEHGSVHSASQQRFPMPGMAGLSMAPASMRGTSGLAAADPGHARSPRALITPADRSPGTPRSSQHSRRSLGEGPLAGGGVVPPASFAGASKGPAGLAPAGLEPAVIRQPAGERDCTDRCCFGWDI